ncbi:MAG: hypothetical protein KF870_15895 [Leadbetterella sp.]|nr:hypothetical protein [Leadbetterella sp.]
MRISVIIAFIFFCLQVTAQDVVPKAKTKEQRKAERKKMTLEQKIENTLPVDVSLPSASLNAPGSQKISSLEDARKYVNETVPNYGKSVKERTRKTAKILKKQESRLFDGKNYKGIAVEKRILKRRSSLLYQEFYVLKEHRDPPPYHRTFTWFDEKNKRVSEVLARDPKTNSLLHGPYREYRGDNLVKEGYYYMGLKDGRWLQYDKDFILLDKENYHEGFYDESRISYYGGDSTRIREVVPVRFGKINGTYYRFYENGTLAEEGRYDDGKKIGKWVEYYEGGNRRKREIQHPVNYFDETEPYTVIEYDDKGKVTFENKKQTR